MQNILLCTDLDRTLIPNGQQAETPGARDLFSEIADREEVTLAYVTGRHRDLIEECIEEYDLPIPDMAIADVGTSVYDINDGQWQHWQSWDDEIARDWNGLSAAELPSLIGDMSGIRLQEPDKQNTRKLSYYMNMDDDADQVMAAIEGRLARCDVQAQVVWSIDEENQVGLLDVLPESAGKRQAIEHIMGAPDIDADKTVFAGDSGNDLDVLTSPIPSVLVANADPRVRQIIKAKAPKSTYLASGDFLGMNGCYASGILEGMAHFCPDVQPILEDMQSG